MWIHSLNISFNSQPSLAVFKSPPMIIFSPAYFCRHFKILSPKTLWSFLISLVGAYRFTNINLLPHKIVSIINILPQLSLSMCEMERSMPFETKNRTPLLLEVPLEYMIFPSQSLAHSCSEVSIEWFSCRICLSQRKPLFFCVYPVDLGSLMFSNMNFLIIHRHRVSFDILTKLNTIVYFSFIHTIWRVSFNKNQPAQSQQQWH